MFGFIKNIRITSNSEYERRYLTLRNEMADPYLENAPSAQALVVSAISVLEKEMNGNGGINWETDHFREHMEVLETYLSREEKFTEEQKSQIDWALKEIALCGKELETAGQSSRDATSAIIYLTHRVVDWVEFHPEKIPLKDSDEDSYLGHF